MLDFFICWIITLIVIRVFVLRKLNPSLDKIKNIIALVMSLVFTLFFTIIQLILDFLVVGNVSNIIIDKMK